MTLNLKNIIHFAINILRNSDLDSFIWWISNDSFHRLPRGNGIKNKILDIRLDLSIKSYLKSLNIRWEAFLWSILSSVVDRYTNRLSKLGIQTRFFELQ